VPGALRPASHIRTVNPAGGTPAKAVRRGSLPGQRVSGSRPGTVIALQALIDPLVESEIRSMNILGSFDPLAAMCVIRCAA
jgi:hypothetical protein